jgi:RND family efflux transporter MFP subunit
MEKKMIKVLRTISGCCAIVLLSPLTSQAQISENSNYDCLIEPSKTIELGSSIRGVADEVLVRRGDAVNKGDVLVRLESAVQKAAVELARTRSKNTAELVSAKESMKLAKKLLTRFEGLYIDKNISQQQLEEAESQAAIAESNWEEARENKVLAELNLDQAQAVLSMRTIRSPIAGIVVDRMIEPGELVTEDQFIMKLANLDPLHVEVILPSTAFGQIESGSVATVMPEEPIGGSFEGHVDIVDSIIDAASGTFRVRVVLPNPEGKLPAGLSCNIDFNSDSETETDQQES